MSPATKRKGTVKHTPEQIERVVGWLDPRYAKEGHELKLLNPHRPDTNRNSFSINTQSGAWSDFAENHAKGRGIVTLVAYYKKVTAAEATEFIHKLLEGRPQKESTSDPAQREPEWPSAPKNDNTQKFSLGRHTFVHSWCYRNCQGHPILRVARFEKNGLKTIRPYHWNGRWVPGDPSGALPLYNLDQLEARPEAPVLVVEGEKAADSAQARFPDYVCTTSPHGANGASKAFWGALKGRSVTIWPDHDDPGREYAKAVTKELQGLATSVSVVQVPSFFPEKWDLADELPDGADTEALLTGARPQRIIRPLVAHVLRLEELLELPIPPRSYLIEPWLAESSLNMVYAPRGLGKSWFALQLAASLSGGKNFFSWEVRQTRRVLLVDGEMPLVILQYRLRALVGANPPEHLGILPSETLWREGRPLNLNDAEDQAQIQNMLDELAQQGRRPDLIIFDNLSSLVAGLDENDNGALDGILQWLMGLRHQGFAVLLVHHTGKSGDQRGASRREDLLDTSIKLEAPKDLEQVKGAAFDIEFTKTRDRRPKPDRLSVMLEETTFGLLSWRVAEAVSEDVKILQAIKDTAPRSARDLANKLHCSPTTMGKRLAALRQRGMVQAKAVALTPEGLQACSDGKGRSWKFTQIKP